MRHAVTRLFAWVLIALLAGSRTTIAKDTAEDGAINQFIRTHQAAVRNNSKGLRFRLSFKDGKDIFRPGELITLVLELTPDNAGDFSYLSDYFGHYEWMSAEDFHVAPASALTNPIAETYSGWFVWNGGNPPTRKLHGPLRYELDLNEWWRITESGKYSIYATTLRAMSKNTLKAAGKYQGDTQLGGFFSNQLLKSTSNVLHFEILPRDAEGELLTLKTVMTALDAPDQVSTGESRSTDLLSYAVGSEPCRSLRYLQSEPAAHVLVARYAAHTPSCLRETYLGLFNSPQRELIISEMEKLLIAHDCSVDEQYLDTLTRLKARSGKEEVGMHGSPRMEKLKSEYYFQLSTVVLKKSNPARVTGIAALMLDQGSSRRAGSAFTPEQASSFREALIADFLLLQPQTQDELLQIRWPFIRANGMIPVLRHIASSPPETQEQKYVARLDEIALERLIELAPEEARMVVLDEIRTHADRTRRIGLRYLTMLPDANLPALDDVLLSGLNAQRLHDDTDIRHDINSTLLARYGTAGVLLGVKEFLRQNKNAHGDGGYCFLGYPELLGYLFQYDPIFAEIEYQNVLHYRTKLDQCDGENWFFSRLADAYYSPQIEKHLSDALDLPNLEFAGDAARALGEHGSPAAEQLLWNRLEKLSRKARSTNPPNLFRKKSTGITFTPQVKLQENLILGLTAAKSWVLDLPKLKRLKALLALPYQEGFVNDQLYQWEHGLEIRNTNAGRLTLNIDVGRLSLGYGYGYPSVESLLARLAQFPAGTKFRWRSSGSQIPDAAATRSSVESFLKAHGMALID